MSTIKKFIFALALFSTSTAGAQMAQNIENMDIITSAKLCATAQGVRSYYSYNPIKLDPENVLVEKVGIPPVKLNALSSYEKSVQVFDKASADLEKCLERNRRALDAMSSSIDTGWKKGKQDSEFEKGRKLVSVRGIGKSDSDLMSDDIFFLLKKMKSKAKGLGRLNLNVYLSEKEIEMLREHTNECKIRNSGNKEGCDEEAMIIAKKLFPNFIYTEYVESAYHNFSNAQYLEFKNKKCGKENQVFEKAEKDKSDKESRALSILQSLGLDIDWFNESKIYGLRALLANDAQLFKFNYKPSQERVKKLNADLNSNDEKLVHHARILKTSINKPQVLFYNPIQRGSEGLQGYLGADINIVGDGGMYDQCESEDITTAYKLWMQSLGSSVGSGVK